MRADATPLRSTHPLLRLLLAHPELLAEHAAAYAALAAEDGQLLWQHWRRQARWRLLAAAAALLGLSFAGQGLMLAVLLGPLDAGALSVLLLTPVLPLALALVCHQVAASPSASASTQRAFTALQQQLAADLALLREAAQAPRP